MPARDDSVVRGSLIACAIFLVLSLITNFILWSWADTSDAEASRAKQQLSDSDVLVGKQDQRIQYLLAVVGVAGKTQAELDDLAQRGVGDANFEKAVADVKIAMSYFGPEVDPSRKNLSYLPEYLTGQIRTLSDQYNNAMQAQLQEKARADAEIEVAQNAQKTAEDLRQKAEDEMEALAAQFAQDREAMKLASAQLQDKVDKQAAAHRTELGRLNGQVNSLQTEKEQLITTIDMQRREINRMQNSEFEVAQGEVTYTRPGDRLVMVNLGAADALRKGVTFEVFDSSATRVTDSASKATIEILAIRGDHLAEARLLGDTLSGNPVLPGDKIYSPFWSPGRRVRIAMAGAIDVNRDGKGTEEDIAILRGAIESAGAEVAAIVDPSGRRAGQELDSDIRFLVVGKRPEATAGADAEQTEKEQRAMAEIGAIIEEARQRGITIISADKLLGFLKTMDDSVTIPLGPNARASDFAPERMRGVRREASDISDFYRRTPPRGN